MPKTADCSRVCRDCARAPLSRRAWLGAVIVGLLVFLPRRALSKRLAISLDKVPQLKRIGSFVILRILGREVLLIRTGEASVHAIHAVCSHKRSRLAYDHEKRKIVCPNHGSTFTLEGRVLKGPAEKNVGPVYGAALDRAKKRILLRL